VLTRRVAALIRTICAAYSSVRDISSSRRSSGTNTGGIGASPSPDGARNNAQYFTKAAVISGPYVAGWPGPARARRHDLQHQGLPQYRPRMSMMPPVNSTSSPRIRPFIARLALRYATTYFFVTACHWYFFVTACHCDIASLMETGVTRPDAHNRLPLAKIGRD